MARLFGTDGVRGEANVTLTPEMAYRFGEGGNALFRRKNGAAAIDHHRAGHAHFW
jgi:phosphoglucosamine mutase